MKKTILLCALLFANFMFSQSITTGEVTLSADLRLTIDVGASETTITMTGPSNAWFAVGFGGSTMTSGADVIRTDGTTILDARTTFRGLPPEDASQDLTVVSNSVSGDERTIVLTRANNTGDANDFVFTNSLTSLPVIWARGTSTTYAYHGRSRGATAVSFGATLSTSETESVDFSVYPNPASENVTIQLPSSSKATANFYDYVGRLVLAKEITSLNNTINISSLNSGAYILKIVSEDKIGSQKFIKN